MKAIVSLQTKYVYWYYSVLLVVMFLLMSLRPDSVSSLFRVVITTGFLLPVILDSRCFVFAFPCVWTVNLYSFSHVMPENRYLYLGIALLYLVANWQNVTSVRRLLIIWFYYAMVCLLSADDQLFLMMTLIGIIVFSGVNDAEDLKLLNNAIVMASLFYSLLFLLNRDVFAESFADDMDLERSFWINPNTFGSLVCCGSALAVGHATRQMKMKISKAEYVLYVVTAILGVAVLIMNASRGALFSFSAALALFVLLSRTKMAYKIVFVLLAALLVFLLYENGFFELLQYRMEGEDIESAGSRSDIWQAKLGAYTNFNFVDLLFGRSRSGVNTIDSLAGKMSTHNDFVTALVGYGLIGFILYLGMYVATFIKADEGKKLSVFILLLTLAMEGLVVEPIFRGNYMCIMFFVFIYKYATIPAAETEEDVEEDAEEDAEKFMEKEYEMIV